MLQYIEYQAQTCQTLVIPASIHFHDRDAKTFPSFAFFSKRFFSKQGGLLKR